MFVSKFSENTKKNFFHLKPSHSAGINLHENVFKRRGDEGNAKQSGHPACQPKATGNTTVVKSTRVYKLAVARDNATLNTWGVYVKNQWGGSY